MSRSDNDKEERPSSPEVFFVGGRLGRDSVSAGGFEAFVVTTLGLWMTALFVVFRTAYELKLEEPDLAITAEASATLAGLALAFLTLIYQLNPKDRFLKLGFSFLTFVLLLSTIFVVAAVISYEKSFEATPRVDVWFLSSAVLLVPLLSRRLAKERWSKYEHIAYLLPFLIPLPLITAISDRKLLTASVLLLLLAVIGLPILMVAFVYGTFRRRSEETPEEQFFSASVERWQMRLKEEAHFEGLKGKLLDILRRKRDAQHGQFNEKFRDTDDCLIPIEELRSHPELPNESQTLINRALGELADRNKIYSEHTGGYSRGTRHLYIAPTPEEVAEALSYFRKHPVIVLLMEENPSADLKDLRLAKDLAKKFLYPRSVVGKYLLEPLTTVLKEEYLRSTDRTGGISKWEIYVRRDADGPQRGLDMWEAKGRPLSFVAEGSMSYRLRQLLSQNVLPEGIDEVLNKQEHLDKFLFELRYLLPRLRQEISDREAAV